MPRAVLGDEPPTGEPVEHDLQITWRNIEPDEQLETLVRDRAAQLERYFDRLLRCRVMVEMPHRHGQEGNLVHVRIDMTVPGREIVVGRHPDAHQQHENAKVAIRDAFKAARRQLQDHARKIRGDVKRHSQPELL